MKKNAAKLLLSFVLILLSGWETPIAAQDIPEPMNPPRLVNDFSGIFSDQQKQDLEAMLRAYNDTTSTQIYVVTVNDLQGYAASDYAYRIGEKWGIGQKGKNNGAVILIKPKKGNSRGDLYISTGYGLEAKLNDARCGRIMDEYMIPHFRQNDYYSGTKAGVIVMIKYLSGEFKADKKKGYKPGVGSMIILVFLVIFFVIMFSRIGKNGGNDGNSGSGGGGMFFPPIIGSGRRSSDDDTFGGFGGGDFGGGGGGSFGGGGAGRSW